MKIKDVLNYLNDLCPFKIQDKYDNSGLIIGNINDEVKKVLVSLDCTDEVVNEAKYFNSNLIISHHPVNISNIKTLKDNLFFEKTIIKAIKNNISIIAVHTNIDFVYNGVNNLICNNLNIINKRILKPHDNVLIKIVIFTSKYCKYIIKNFIDKNIDSNFIDYKEYKYDDFNKMKNYNQNFCFLKKKILCMIL
ncbi:MAG: Nif3-like dinuclear metal center hexameric protein [Bacteroides sp.]|nr:MAG: Nif3-like dinuclear metal center hexameric protein [Bacteroides sp.]